MFQLALRLPPYPPLSLSHSLQLSLSLSLTATLTSLFASSAFLITAAFVTSCTCSHFAGVRSNGQPVCPLHPHPHLTYRFTIPLPYRTLSFPTLSYPCPAPCRAGQCQLSACPTGCQSAAAKSNRAGHQLGQLTRLESTPYPCFPSRMVFLSCGISYFLSMHRITEYLYIKIQLIFRICVISVHIVGSVWRSRNSDLFLSN